MKPRICILRTDGTNCDGETAHAFSLAGGDPRFVHVNQLRDKSSRLRDFQALVIPGGFSYGDDVASGKILALELLAILKDELLAFTGPVLGICNGFQVLVKAGLLPFLPETGEPLTQRATLTHNDSGHFQCEWVKLDVEEGSCLFTKGMNRECMLPIAHGEGRFVADERVLDDMERRRCVALRYSGNPNGSMRRIAGACDPSGRVFGLMPHPERFVERTQYPNWRQHLIREPHGLPIFRNAVTYAANL